MYEKSGDDIQRTEAHASGLREAQTTCVNRPSFIHKELIARGRVMKIRAIALATTLLLAVTAEAQTPGVTGVTGVQASSPGSGLAMPLGIEDVLSGSGFNVPEGTIMLVPSKPDGSQLMTVPQDWVASDEELAAWGLTIPEGAMVTGATVVFKVAKDFCVGISSAAYTKMNCSAPAQRTRKDRHVDAATAPQPVCGSNP